jgi:uncharacterized membrane protein
MAHAENTITISRPADAVYAFLADGLNNPKWRDGVVTIELKSGPPAEKGAEYRQVLKGPGGRPVDGDYRLISAEPGRALAFEVTTGPARPTGRYELASTDDGGTEVSFILDYQAKGLKKFMEPMVQKAMQSEVDSLPALKRVLEAS